MYKVLLTPFLFASVMLQSQTVFFYEDFGIGCNQGGLANGAAVTPTNGIWSVQNIYTGPGNGPQDNNWFISATEAGKLNGFCGESCISTPSLTNRSLHIAANMAPPNYDPGANYIITPTSNTNKLVFITVDCSLYSNITMSFVCFSGQIPGSDYAEVNYYDGVSWTTLSPLGGPSTCSANIGLWADHIVQLPPSADGNPYVRIGFRWQNNSGANSSGISVAIDNIRLSGSLSTSLKNLFPNENLILFPNPIINVLNVRFKNKLYSNCSIKLYNSWGQKLREENSLKEDNFINMADCPAGVYYLDLDRNGIHNWSKVIKIND